jgi:hypothetical protein
MEKINFTRGVPVVNGVRFQKPDGVREVNATNEEEPLLPNGIELNSQNPGVNLVEDEGEHLIPASMRIGESHTKSVDDDDDDVNLRRNII